MLALFRVMFAVVAETMRWMSVLSNRTGEYVIAGIGIGHNILCFLFTVISS